MLLMAELLWGEGPPLLEIMPRGRRYLGVARFFLLPRFGVGLQANQHQKDKRSGFFGRVGGGNM